MVDSEGLTVPLGSPGELWIRSYNNMVGYWQDEESTAKVVTSDRWLKTGYVCPEPVTNGSRQGICTESVTGGFRQGTFFRHQ